MIELKNIKKTYKSKKNVHTPALKGISLKFENKGLVFILGKSGCGKSTLLNIVGGLDKCDEGEIIINGKSTKGFLEKDFDAYRNTYIGFIFQEFNLIDNYSIYKNIALSLELQHKKIDIKEIDNILKIVGLESYGNRKPSELSGGQKQRIAIARALIKNPNVILADEPTGNLDSVTSRQIFELLKELSREKLVIIISHDEESAQRYADRIIKLEDGIIIGDTKKNIDDSTNSNKLVLIDAKLPLKYSIKMGIGNLFYKKLRLLFTIFLISFSIISFGLMMSATSFDLNQEHLDTLIKNNEYEVVLSKYNEVVNYENLAKKSFSNFFSYDDSTLKKLEITDTLISEANAKTGLKWYKENTIVQDSQNVSFDFALKNIDETIYYQEHLPVTFIEIENNDLIPNVIGNIPMHNDEIVISKYLADNIIQNGIYLDKLINEDKEIYKPKSYNQIISDDVHIKLQGLSKKLKIVGIVDDDLSNIEDLKVVTYDDYLSVLDYEDEYQELISSIPKYSRIYVSKDFISNLELKENNMLYEVSKILVNDNYYLVSQIGYMINGINYFDGKTITQNIDINDDEVVIDLNVLNDITNGEYQKQLELYLENNIYYDSSLISNYTIDFIKKNNIIGKKIKSSVTKEKIVHKKNLYNQYIIKGVTFNENLFSTIYYSKEQLKNISIKNLSSDTIFTVANDTDDLIKIFSSYPIDKSSIISSTKYTDGIFDSLPLVYLIKIVGKYGSIFFLVFSIFLLINFINTSINYRKKEIGILRALGCKGKDILNMFVAESLILLFICLLISNVGITKIVNIFNNTVSSFVNNDINFLVYGSKQRVLLFVITFLIILISNILPIRKITKMQPVDAICNK